MMQRYLYTLFLLIVSCTFSLADVYRYRVFFDGKPDSQPVALTERAQERRLRLGIESDEADYEVSASYLQQLREAGLTILARSRWMNSAVVMSPDGTEVSDNQWTSLPFVKKVEMITAPKNGASHTNKAPERSTTEDTRAISLVENCTTPLREVNAYTSLYSEGYRGKNMLIAVFDGGFMKLDKCSWLIDKVVFAYDLYHPETTTHVFEGDNHGIMCMSIMACPESYGVCGTAQEAEYCLFVSENSDYEKAIEEDMWVIAAEMSDSLGVDVISSSLGYCTYDGDLQSHSHEELVQNTAFVSQGAKIAVQKGMLVVNSSGNEGQKSWKRMLFPADTEEVLSVGAVTPSFEPADFTGQGCLEPYVKPDVSARGTYCYAVVPTDKGFGIRSKASGTSFSTPLIAGLCASLWSAVPDLSPADIRKVVNESASDFNSPNILTGYGLPDFEKALAMAKELNPHTGIEEITTEATGQEPVASGYRNTTYNLMGQPLATPPSQGVYFEKGKKIYSK